MYLDINTPDSFCKAPVLRTSKPCVSDIWVVSKSWVSDIWVMSKSWVSDIWVTASSGLSFLMTSVEESNPPHEMLPFSNANIICKFKIWTHLGDIWSRVSGVIW